MLLSFKDFLLIGFFLSIGLIGFPTQSDFLIVVLLIALFEPWIANRISLRHYARPAQTPVVGGTADHPVPPSPTPEPEF